MKQSSQESQWQSQILSWLTSTPERIPQQIILQIMLIIWMIGAVIYAVGYQLIESQTPTTVFWRLVVIMALYAVSRTRYYQYCAIACIVFLLIQPYFIFVPFIPVFDPSALFITAIFALPLSIILLTGKTRRVFIWISTVVTIITLLLGVTQTGIFSALDVLLIVVLGIANGLIFPFIIATQYVRKTVSPTAVYDENLLERIPDMVMIFVNNHITYINPAGLRMIGTDNPDDVIGQPLNKFIPERDNNTPTSDRFSMRMGDMSEWHIQTFEDLQRLDGETTRIIATRTLLDPDDTHTTLLTAKPSTHALSATDTIVESADAILSVQIPNKILYTSSEFERISGYSREEVYAHDYMRFKFIHDDDLDRVSQWIRQVFADEATDDYMEYRILRKSADPIWVRSTARSIRYLGKPASLFTTVTVEDYKQDAPSLDLIASVPVPYLLVQETNGQITIVDGQLDGLDIAPPIQTLIGKPLKSVLAGTPVSLKQVFHDMPSSQATYIQRDNMTGRNEETLPVEWTVTCLEDYPPADFIILLRSIENEIQLEDEIERFQYIFNLMNDYAYTLKVLPDDQYEFIWASHAFKAITGYDVETESTSDILANLYHPDDRDKMAEHFVTLRQGQGAVQEYRIQTKYGQTRYMREYAYPVLKDDQPRIIYGSVSDTTANVLAEQTLKNYAMQQAVIAEVGMVAVSNQSDIHDFARQALNLIVQLMEVPYCILIELNEGDRQFSPHTVIGYSWDASIDSTPDDKSSYLGYILHQNDAVIVNDWSTESRFKKPQVIESHNIRSTLSVVVPMQNAPFGILNIHSDEIRRFTSENINTLQMVANIIGAYIQQKRIQQAEHEHHMVAQALSDIAALLNSATELDDILLIILNFVAQIVPVVDSSNIMLINHERGIATIKIRHNVSENIPPASSGREIPLDDIPLYTEVIETRKPIVINDVSKEPRWHNVPETSWIQSYLAAPIFAGDECLGVVNLDSVRRNAFTHDHLEQLVVRQLIFDG